MKSNINIRVKKIHIKSPPNNPNPQFKKTPPQTHQASTFTNFFLSTTTQHTSTGTEGGTPAAHRESILLKKSHSSDGQTAGSPAAKPNRVTAAAARRRTAAEDDDEDGDNWTAMESRTGNGGGGVGGGGSRRRQGTDRRKQAFGISLWPRFLTINK